MITICHYLLFTDGAGILLDALDVADSLLAARVYSKGNIGGFAYLPAKISKISNNTQHNYIIINKGEADGVEKGAGIITEQGAIGVVDAVSENFSFVRSFLNHGMSISARLGKNGVSGPLSWDGIHSNKALLKEIPQHLNVNPGDTMLKRDSVEHGCVCLKEGVLLDIFTPMREDFIK